MKWRLPALPIAGVDFRHVADFPGYCVGSDGSVWSCKNARWGYRSEWRRLKTPPNADGYLEVGLCRPNARPITQRVHVLVLRAFVGPPPAGMEGCHEDGDPTNCALTNLRWDTRKANCDDTRRHGNRVGFEKRKAVAS